MSKSSTPNKKKPSSKSISVGGNASNSVFIEGDKNKVTVQLEQKPEIAYGLFTIPQPVADFTGRDKELEHLKASFSCGAIITGLSGAGGIGKTELARKLAHDIAENFPDAQMNIDLLGTSERPTSSEDAMRRLLEPFHVGQKLPDDETQLKNLYQHTFGKKKVLLLLDNAANAVQVRPLIPPLPSVAIITSRQHFSLTEYGLHEPVHLDVLSPEKARELLRNASPKLNDSPDDKVNELSKLCGYLPLALRVAVSLLNDRSDWTVNTLINRLQDEHTRLKHLKREGDYDVEATLNLSYELLSGNLKKYFRSLGIFTAPFTKDAVKAVLETEDKGMLDEDELDDILGKLISRSLLNYQRSQEFVKDLYSLHDLTRLYTAQKILDKHEYEEFLSRHAVYFLELASDANDLYKKGNENVLIGLTQFRFIWPHLYSSYERLLPDQDEFFRPQIADRWLSAFPRRCAYVLSLYILPRERLIILHVALDAARRLGDTQDEGHHLSSLGFAYAALGNVHKSISHYQQALSVAKVLGNRSGEATALGGLGVAYKNLGYLNKSVQFCEDQLAIAREIASRTAEASALCNLGIAYKDLGDLQKSIEFHNKALMIYLDVGDRRGEGNALGNLGVAFAALGNNRESINMHKRRLEVAREIGDLHGEGNALGNLGNVYLKLEEFSKAIEYYEQTLAIYCNVGDQRGEGAVLSNLGEVRKRLGEKEEARIFWNKALLIFRDIGSPYAEITEKSLIDLDEE